MNADALAKTARALLAEGKGLLAMDESTPTCGKRFERYGISRTIEARNSAVRNGRYSAEMEKERTPHATVS